MLPDFSEITRIFSGMSAIASDPMPPNESDVYVFYKPISQWPKTEGCLIVLDLAMPRMDSATFRMKLLRDHPEFAQIPVIIVSGETHNAAVVEQLAIADYMAKPFDADRLLALVARYCARRGA